MTNDSAISYAIALLSHYGFELRGYTAQELVNLWLEQYQANWVRMGVIEALYQGRYKAVSVEQILAVWARRGKPMYRFTHEFERLISRKLPKSWTPSQDLNSTDLEQELSLSSLTASFPEISLEEELPEVNHEEEALSVFRETVPPSKTVLSDFTETQIQSTEECLEVPRAEDANLSQNAGWSHCEFSKLPIEKFIPPPDYSGFYLKLKAVVTQQDSTAVNDTITVSN